MSLLDKASLVQIPSGYKATKLYSVVPDSGAGDFDFSRSSSATRVNAEGLIEVAKVLGTTEEVTNGDFSSGGDWSGSASISGGQLTKTSGGLAYQSGVVTANKYYKVVVDVESLDGATQLYFGGNQYTLSVGVQTIEAVGGTSNTFVGFNNGYSSGSGSVFNSISVIQYIENDVPRLDYSGGATCPTLLLEPQRTNLNIQSNSSFVINNCTIDYNNATSPEGITNAYRATATGTSASFVRSLNIAFTDPSAFSVFLKHGNNEWMQIINAGNVNHYVNVNIETGDLGTFGSNTSDLLVEDYGNGWYRVSGKFSGYTGSGTLRVYMANSSSSGWAATTATIGNYYYGYGFQVESNASYATSYIPTNGATATRTADVCENAGTSATFNDAEGVLFAEISALADDQTSRGITIDGDGNSENRVLIQYQPSFSNQIRGLLKNDDNSSVELIYVLSDITDNAKIAFKYKSGDLALWVNGVERATSSSAITLSGLQELSFDNGRGDNNFYGKCKQLIYFDQALTDDELETLTTL